MLGYMKEMIAAMEPVNASVAGFNVFGYEDAVAVIKAAESLEKPVLLMVNLPAARHMPLAIMGGLLTKLAQSAKVPVGIHLDHAKELDSVKQALDSGFTSVMFDGADLPFEQNVQLTQEMVRMAKAYGAATEAEIGFVGYTDSGQLSERTDPDEAARFAEQTQVDALAVSVGTVHRLTVQNAKLDLPLLQTIHSMIPTPLVIHGASGLPEESLRLLGENGVRKINFGTTLRMAFGKTLRRQFDEDPDVFDRIALFGPCMQEVEKRAHHIIKTVSC